MIDDKCDWTTISRMMYKQFINRRANYVLHKQKIKKKKTNKYCNVVGIPVGTFKTSITANKLSIRNSIM